MILCVGLFDSKAGCVVGLEWNPFPRENDDSDGEVEKVLQWARWCTCVVPEVPFRREEDQWWWNTQTGTWIASRCETKPLSYWFFQLEMENDDVIEVYQEQTGGSH